MNERDWLDFFAGFIATLALIGLIFGYCYWRTIYKPEPCWHGRSVPSYQECDR